MLDGCGIETCSDPLGLYPGGLVAIDARWLWNRDYSWRKGEPRWCSRSRSMLDGCGIETLREISVRSVGSVFVAIDARWLWNRDMNRWQTYNGRVAAVAIDARWLWNRDPAYANGP